MCTPSNKSSLEDEVTHVVVEHLDEHSIHGVSFHCIPHEGHEGEVISEHVADSTFHLGAGSMFSDVENDEEADEGDAEVEEDPGWGAFPGFPGIMPTLRSFYETLRC